MQQSQTIDSQNGLRRWRCHRGMLELDMLLLPYYDGCANTLTTEQLALFDELLTHPDPDIYNWLLGFSEAPTPSLCATVTAIRDFHRVSHST